MEAESKTAVKHTDHQTLAAELIQLVVNFIDQKVNMFHLAHDVVEQRLYVVRYNPKNGDCTFTLESSLKEESK